LYNNDKHNIRYNDIALLTEIGLIQPGTFINFQLVKQINDSQIIFTSGNIIIIVKIKANTPTVKMPVDVFSNSGNELIKLLKPSPPFEYLKYIANSIKSDLIDVKYAHILAWEEDSIRHTQPLQEFK
jgi:hypothetical protein